MLSVAVKFNQPIVELIWMIPSSWTNTEVYSWCPPSIKVSALLTTKSAEFTKGIKNIKEIAIIK